MSYLCYLCLLVYSGTFALYSTHLHYAMSSMAGVLSIRDMSCLLFARACTVHFVFVWGPCVCIVWFSTYCGLCAQRCDCLWIVHSCLFLPFSLALISQSVHGWIVVTAMQAILIEVSD